MVIVNLIAIGIFAMCLFGFIIDNHHIEYLMVGGIALLILGIIHLGIWGNKQTTKSVARECTSLLSIAHTPQDTIKVYKVNYSCINYNPLDTLP